jgi:4a-hydroxytetrahydrobiopterin dehydratase
MTVCDLTQKRCVPCEGGVPPLTTAQASELLKSVRGWELKGNQIQKSYKFKDFSENMGFVTRAALVAEAEGHHPDLNIHQWNRLTITLWTHAINGLSENDFIVAAKLDALENRK